MTMSIYSFCDKEVLRKTNQAITFQEKFEHFYASIIIFTEEKIEIKLKIF